jgi:hypothetical protein
MRKGNVIRCPSGLLWVVVGISDKQVHAVSFDSENVSATARLKDRTYDADCPHCYDERMDDCEHCQGKGRITVVERGWENAEVLAPNVREFIMRAVRRTFGI